MDFFKTVTLFLFSFQCVITDDHYGDIEDRMLEIQRRLTALKQNIEAINDNALLTETNIEENRDSLNEMFSEFVKKIEGNFGDLRDKFSKHYLKHDRRKLSKLLQETDDSTEDRSQEELTDTNEEDGLNGSNDSKYDDFGIVFKASKLTKTTFGGNVENHQKETIVFSDIEYNIGDGYNSTTGIFMTPRKGTYLFTVQFYVKYGHRIEAGIFSNGENTIAVTSLAPGNNACYNFEGIANLENGDLVEVKHLDSKGSGDLLDNTFNSNFFSGAMIR